MKVDTLDLETYWDDEHTLSKMSPIAYCMSPKTEIISCAFKTDDGPPEVVFGEENVKDRVAETDWSDSMVIGHNMAEFDAMILSWRLGLKPMMWGCTQAMARPHFAKVMSLSLDSLSEHFGYGRKNSDVLHQTKGRHLKDFTPEEIDEMSVYNAGDVNKCFGIFKSLLKMTPKSELRLIDMTIRMLVEPVFDVDRDLLRRTLREEALRRTEMMTALGKRLAKRVPAHIRKAQGGDVTPLTEAEVLKVLRSADKFTSLMSSLGVQVPMKPSPSDPNKEIPALAKTDQDFVALQEHPNPLVAAAVEARLNARSTILQSRIMAFLTATDAHPQSKLPIPLRYSGADTTTRWSGWGYNPQNLNRVIPGMPRPSDALRMSIMAPKGHAIVVVDQSGIEMRVNMFLWKVPYAMKLFQQDPAADLYKPLASEVLGVPMEGMPREVRQAGKAMHLGCGFGLGTPSKYVSVARQMAQIEVSLEEAEEHIFGYRRKHTEVVRGWKSCHKALPVILRGAYGAPVDPWGMVSPTPEGLKTPKGTILYPDLRQEPREDSSGLEFWYGSGRHRARIYAGKVDENIVQHLARHIIADNALSIHRATGYRPKMFVHDELVYVAPVSEAEALLKEAHAVLRRPVSWWPELVTWSEGGVSERYGEAK